MRIPLYTWLILCMMIASGTSCTRAQSTFRFTLELKPLMIEGLPGLHSFAYAQHDGKWLIIGGRTDGLHARQPFNSFPEKNNNATIYVVDVAKKSIYSASVDALPDDVRDQMQSANMNFYQEGNTLYVIGGYGFSPAKKRHITYPNLTAIDVPGLITAIQKGEPVVAYFTQITDDGFAVAGGQLGKIDHTFYLVGGHRFDGRYNPMGHPSYRQHYTNEIRRFTLEKTSNSISFTALPAWQDEQHLRRRDFNLLPMMISGNTPAYLLSSGVFQEQEDLPFLYPVLITHKGYEPITGFRQYLSNYHSAKLSLYDKSSRQMHMLFFGGMSQHYMQDGERVRDDRVPFVNTISLLTYFPDGSLTETALPVEMPCYTGASAEFILNPALSHTESDIILLDQRKNKKMLLGYIVGGITSPSTNPFSQNQTNTTRAEATVYEVYLERTH
jgi:hypothetical protein